jgi:ribulose-5-phosphate 4-epimerase/fuculose-1-phosphate aldolase
MSNAPQSIRCVLVRRYGATVTGPSLRHVVYRAVYTEVNARMQAEAKVASLRIASGGSKVA